MTYIQLRQYIKKAPLSPGTYEFLDRRGKAIYIGKASLLPRRLTSYLKTEDSRIKIMIGEAASIKFSATASEIEALILESLSIKDQKPKYNILLRDDKQYFYVAITKEEFPKLFLTHQTSHKGVREYIGPFTDGPALKTTLKYLRRIFPYCTCTQKHNNFCLNYHIGKCIGYCCLKNPPEKEFHINLYRENIQAITGILKGKKRSLIDSLMKEMRDLAKNHELEKAIVARDKVEKLKRVFENASLLKTSPILARVSESGLSLTHLLKLDHLLGRLEGYDISNIQGGYAVGVMVAFSHGKPRTDHYRKFKIKFKSSKGDTGMLAEILERRFNHPEWEFPDLIVIDGGKAQRNIALEIIKNLGLNIPVVALTKDERHTGKYIFVQGRKLAIPLSKLKASDRNLILHIDSEAHRFAIRYYRRLHGRNFLN
ncbi:MAG TPA: GIY-YIG nuclease family protein [Candidatus Paceibacterota bacterium]